MLVTLRRVIIAMLVGALAGAVVASLAAPGFLSWYNTPGSGGQALCNCPELVRAVTAQLLRAQLIGAAIGAVIFGLATALLLRWRRSPRRAVKAGSGKAPDPKDPSTPES